MELLVGERVHHQREDGRGRRDEQRRHHHRAKEPQHADAGRLEGDDLQIAGQAAAGQQHGHQQRHGERVGEERGQHEDEQLEHEVERHALGDDEVGQMINAVDDEEEREERAAEAEGRDQLPDQVAVDDRQPWRLHAIVVPYRP